MCSINAFCLGYTLTEYLNGKKKNFDNSLEDMFQETHFGKYAVPLSIEASCELILEKKKMKSYQLQGNVFTNQSKKIK